MRLTLARLAAGLALLTALAAGCSAASANHPPAVTHTPETPVPAATQAASPVQTRW
jgi:hypothetical protein